MTKKVKMGKIKLPMDVRSSNDVPAFENMLSGGPMAVVLVYADWCGHCDTYKKNVWSPLKSMKKRSVNLASVHHDQLENTSLKGSKIDGYPSILVVGKDKKPALFNSNSGTTNAMPNTNEVSTMKKLITTPVPEEDEFTPTFENEPIEEGTDISLPSIKASMDKENDKPMNDRERALLEDFRKNTHLYMPKNSSTRTNSANSSNRMNSSANSSNSMNSSANSMNSSANSSNSANSMNSSANSMNSSANSMNNRSNSMDSPTTNSANGMNNSAKTLTSIGNINSSTSSQANNSTLNFDKGTPTATETSPPLIEGDDVEEEETTSPNLAPANSQGSTPLRLTGGRLSGGNLFRRLTHKKRKSHRTTKKHSKRKN